MNRRKLKDLERKLEDWRRSPRGIARNELVRVAEKLGRSLSDRGKEPTFVNDHFPQLRPISVPGHRRDLAPGTARNILDGLLEDVECWRNIVEDDETNDDDDE